MSLSVSSASAREDVVEFHSHLFYRAVGQTLCQRLRGMLSVKLLTSWVSPVVKIGVYSPIFQLVGHFLDSMHSLSRLIRDGASLQASSTVWAAFHGSSRLISLDSVSQALL